MARPAKRRAPQHLIDERGIALLKRKIPENWVLREYRPDYGLDFAVEVFDGEGSPFPQTLGEHFFIQLKSTESPKIGALQLHKRGNVEKGGEELNSQPVMSLDTYRLSLETTELVTVERMGVGQPVLLVVADIERQICCFVCLNDYVDKILIPRFDEYSHAEHRTVHIPCNNDLSTDIGKVALRWYAKRSKLISAFQRFTFQYSELRGAEDGDWRSLAEHFAQKIARYDFWDDLEMCPIIGYYRDGLRRFINEGQPRLVERSIPLVDVITFEDEMDDYSKKVDVFQLWHGLSVLPKNYEDIWREWFLPTELGQAMSAPLD
ncbi:MAG: DUF4365 domain-containing protein [Alphaproteobacteria bacterium]|nr:DUF4365 domain-containing protein [Alphaproteobacteria bacterium]